ncbi:unnamed protein product [Rotaria sp. Silwood2]|nr:unnamed protein product [Rotaria sp. Silwood2]CAF3079655.1 unnamed protein product [Rotaria sp. Silwood2]CAF3267363.1 unnamed protein product [Rotaria sp. Silwood2]
MATKKSMEPINKAARSNGKNDHEQSHQSNRDQSQIHCFFQACDREASEKLLRDAYTNQKQKNGIYMLRQSQRDESKFILSLIKDGQCFHYRAHHMGNGTFLDEKTDSVFYSLDELLEYYQADGVRHLRCSLTIPLRGHSLPSFAQRRGTTTVLHQAATKGQRDVIQSILNDQNCPDIHSKNEEGNTPLHEACFFGRDDAVKILLQAGANWKFVNRLGWTSLHQAALGNSPNIVDLLLSRAHADIDVRNPFNLYAPIHCAAACNNLETITTLIAHDSPLRPLTDAGETPYDLAVKHNGNECADKLSAARSKPAVSRRSSYYHGSLTNNQMRALLNYFKKHDGFFFVRQSASVQDDYAISIIWQNRLVHDKIHKKNSNSYYFENPLHYHDSLEHAIDYFMKAYKGVVKPLSPETAKVAYAVEISPSTSQRLFLSSSNRSFKSSNQFLHDSSNSDVTGTSDAHPFNKGRSQNVHNKQKMLSTIEKRLVDPLVNKRVVIIREEQITFGKLLGEGNFGKVFAGEYREEHGRTVPVAIKALKATMDGSVREEMKKEAFVMKELSHPCIVQELLSMGSLLDYLKRHVENATRSLFSFWVIQLIHGMAYMERKRFVHRDLAARNILMQSHSRIKISDFGLSRSVDSNDYYVQHSDTPIPIAWYAPESLFHFKFTSKSDVWSFGVTMWEIYTFGQYPYGSMATEEITQFIEANGRLQRPAGCSTSVYEVMLRCWTYKPHDRPSFPDLLKILANRSEFVKAIQYFHSLSKY